MLMAALALLGKEDSSAAEAQAAGPRNGSKSLRSSDFSMLGGRAASIQPESQKMKNALAAAFLPVRRFAQPSVPIVLPVFENATTHRYFRARRPARGEGSGEKMGNSAGRHHAAMAALKVSVFGDLSPADLASLLELGALDDGCSSDAFSSPLLRVRSAYCCYLVVTGKVVAAVSREGGQPSNLTVFEPGSVICTLPCTFCTAEGAVLCGNNSIVYQKLPEDQPAQVLAFERRKMEEFFAARPHCRLPCHSFLCPSSAVSTDLASLALFRSVSTDRIQLLVAAMKLTSRSAGEGIAIVAESGSRLALQGLEQVFIHNSSARNESPRSREKQLGYFISAEHFRSLLVQNSVLKHLLRRNFYFGLLFERMASQPFLRQLGETRLRALCRRVRIGNVSPGVCPQYQTCCIIVLEGRLRSEGKDQTSRIHGKHDIVNLENLLGDAHGNSSTHSRNRNGGNEGGDAYLVTAVEPSLLLCVTSSALAEAFGHRRQELALLLFQWTRTRISLHHLLCIPEACRQLRRFLPLHNLSPQPLLLHSAILRLEALFQRLQAFAARTLCPKDWRRMAEGYAEALLGLNSFSLPLNSMPSNLSSSGANLTNNARSPSKPLLRRSQASSQLSMMVASIQCSPSRSAMPTSPSQAGMDRDSQELDQVLPENGSRQPLLLGRSEDEEAPAEVPFSRFAAIKQAQTILEQHMDELTGAVKLLFSSFQNKGRQYVTSACAQETERRANQFFKQSSGLSLALFMISLVRKHESSSSVPSVSTLSSYVHSLSHFPSTIRTPVLGSLPASHSSATTASISSPHLLPSSLSSTTNNSATGTPARAQSNQSQPSKEKNEWHEARSGICTAIQAMARNEGDSIEGIVEVESVFALVKEETLDFLQKQAWVLWRESEDFASFVKQMLPMSTDDVQHALIAQDQDALRSKQLRRESLLSSGCLPWPGLFKRSSYIVAEN